MLHLKNFKSKSRGFTVIEVMIMAPILMLVIGVFVGLIVELAGQSVVSRAQSQAVYDVQDALSRVEQDVKTSIGFLATNSFTPTSPQGSSNDTTSFININSTTTASGTCVSSSQTCVLILNMPATTLNPNDPSTKPVYGVNAPSSCASLDVVSNSVLKYNIVYFVSNGSLWRRTMMPSGYNNLTNWCNTPYQQPSCAVGLGCATEDVEVLPYTSSLSLTYYSDGGSTTANSVVNNTTPTTNSNATRDTAFLSLSTVKVDLTSSRTIAGKTVTKTGSGRFTIIKYSPF